MTILKCTGPFSGWKPDPFPGSAEAAEQGCSCPRSQDDWPLHLMLNADCPVHTLDKAVPS